MDHKIDAQTLPKVDSITIHKNMFNINKFQLLIRTDRQVKSTLETKVHIHLLDELTNKHMFRTKQNNHPQWFNSNDHV